MSFLCHFGGARREGGRGRAPTEICTFPEAFSFFVILESFFGHFGVVFFVILESFFCHLGIIFCHFGGARREGGRMGQGTRPKFAHFPSHCHFFVILVSFLCHFGGARREGGWGRAPDRNLHISRGIVIFFGVIFCHLVGCGTREGRAG